MQPTFCDSSEENSSDLSTELQELRYKIRSASATSGIRLGVAGAYVSDRVSVSKDNIRHQLDNLKGTLTEARSASDVCAERGQELAESIDTERFERCFKNGEIAELRRKIAELKGLLAEVDQTETSCLVDSGVDKELVEECIEERIDNVKRSLEEMEEVIGGGIDAVIVNADECASEVERQLEDAVREVAFGFLRCLGGSAEEVDDSNESRS